jgi:hypothetical protein
MIKLTEPTLLLDEIKCRANIQRIVEKARQQAFHCDLISKHINHTPLADGIAN